MIHILVYYQYKKWEWQRNSMNDPAAALLLFPEVKLSTNVTGRSSDLYRLPVFPPLQMKAVTLEATHSGIYSSGYCPGFSPGSLFL
jgi:hypothetical protein